jgi:alkaline phosphatase
MPRSLVLLPALLGLAVCGRADDSASVPAAPVSAAAVASEAVPGPVLLAAGDIGECGSPGRERTAALLDRVPGPILTLGDNAYPNGTPEDYRRCFVPVWGRHLGRIRPALGNHDVRTRGAPGYEETFRSALHEAGGAAADPNAGWYAFDVGEWRVIVLNSNRPRDSRQLAWLRHELANQRGRCTLAAMHHPLVSSGEHGSNADMRPIWQALYDAGAEMVITGHDHDYERFAPVDPSGRPDPRRGIREIVAGTGGAFERDFRRTFAPGSEAHFDHRFGILRLTLGHGTYRWEFLSADDAGRVLDSGTGTCH